MKTLTKSARMRAAIAVLGALGSSSAWAEATCSQVVGSAVTLPMPSTIPIPREAAIGTPLTRWIASAASPNWFICTTTAGWGSGVGFRAFSSTTGQSVTMDGINYPVFTTGMPGIGVIISARRYLNGCGWRDFVPVTSDWTGSACNGQGNVYNGGELRAMLVKTGNITSGVLSPTTIASVALYTNRYSGLLEQHPTLGFTFVTPAANIVSQACLTPDVSVSLGPHQSNVFTGPGTSSPVAQFDISLNGCPAGLAGIQYRIDAVTPILDAGNAVVSLDASSSAAGLGIQLLDSNNNPAPLGIAQTFSSYNAATGGNFKIPMRARYRQTGSSVTPGSANAAMTFTISYL